MGARRAHVAAAVLAAVLLAGCGGSPSGPGRAAVEAPVAVLAQADVRQVVYTADLTVRVGDAARAAQRATAIVTGAGGIVFALSTDLEGRKEARLTLKVSPERFDAVLDELAALGTSLDRDVKARDVTDEVVDVDGRLRTAQASVDRLRTLLGEARTAADLVVVESELAKREGELEALQGKLRVLSSQVELATVNVRLAEQARVELARGVPGFGTALHTGWVALLNVLTGAVAVAGFALPFAPLAVGAGWAVRRQRQRRSVSSSTS